MTKRLFSAIVLFALTLCAGPAQAAQSAGGTLAARGAILMNLRSESVLYVQDENAPVAPASLAKIMTLYVAMDALRSGQADLSDNVRISARAASQRGSLMHLKQGDVVPLGELLAGTAAASGNDAAVAVAEHLAGSEAAFVKRMNATAKRLGLKNTAFTNPHGLPPAAGQRTTARDMLTLSKRYLEDHPEALPYHSLPFVAHGEHVTTNKNPLLKTCPGTDGLKPGWIRASGFNLVATAKRGDVRLVMVVLGAPTSRDMRSESLRLMEAGFKTVASGGAIKVVQWLKEEE